MLPPSSVLDRASAILVVVDVQERLAAAMERRDAVTEGTCLAIGAATIVGMPIVVTRQYPQGLGDTLPQIAAALTDAESSGASVRFVDKVAFDCFAEPAFADAVCSTGRSQLLLAGMESHICICQTALAGLREGYDVHVAADACCSRDASMHDWALARLGSAGAVVTTSESAAYELVEVAGTTEFKELLAIVKRVSAGR